MSSLKFIERKALEAFLGMSGGYVLDFKNSSFREFIEESVDVNPDDDRFGINGTSKANRLRTLWKLESDAVVGRLLHALIDYATTLEAHADGWKQEDERQCRQIAARLMTDGIPLARAVRASIFISYRRDDTSAEARLVFDRLKKAHGPEAVFMDVSSIQPGATWPREIEENLASASIVIAIIGPQWLAGADQWGKRRIDDESDWVRRELEEALKTEKRLIPLLVKGANVPPASALPESLKELFLRQCVEVRRDYWDHDIGLLEVALGTTESTPAVVPMRAQRGSKIGDQQPPAAIKRERDLEHLTKVFHWIHLGVLDVYIDRIGNYARATNAGSMIFERLRDVVGSSRFYLSDVELRKRLDEFMVSWGNTQRHIHEMIPDRRGMEMIFYMPGDLFQSREQKKHVEYVMGQALPMKLALDRFIGYVREHYLEIDPNECGIEALSEYEIEEAETKEILRLQRELEESNEG